MGFSSSRGLGHQAESVGTADAVPEKARHALTSKAADADAAAAAEVDRNTANNTSSNDSSAALDPPSSPATSSNEPSQEDTKHFTQTPTVATTRTEKETVNTYQSSSFATPSSAFSVADDGTVGIQTMPEDFARKLCSQIHRKLDQFLAKSSYIESHSQLHNVPRFEYGSLPLGKTIAKGGFSQIIEVNNSNTGSNVVSLLDGNSHTTRSCDGQESQYVVKCLSTKLPLKKLPGATKDIIFEAHTLSSLNHENIIKIRGLSKD